MAPTVEANAEKKKSGIRRLLSPIILSGETHKRKETAETKIPRSPKHNEVKTSVETAFVGVSQIPRTKATHKCRSQSLSPVRYGSCTRTETRLNLVENIDPNYYNGSVPKGINIAENKNSHADAANRKQAPNLVQMKISDTNHSSDGSLFSTASSSPREHRRINASSEDISNCPPESRATNYRSGRTSAPPAPYSQYYTRSSHKSHIPQPRDIDLVRLDINEYHQIKSQQMKQISEKDYVIKKRMSPIMFCRKEVIPTDRKVPNTSISTYSQSRTILRPHPLYRSKEEPPRPRSVSPITGSNKEDAFVRGCTQRSTISGYCPRQSVIYEECSKETRLNEVLPTTKSGPIFKRGALLANSPNSMNNNVSKKVSFSPGQEASSEPIYWPTRKGLAVEPPTRQSTRRDSSNSNVYMNVPSPNRPLPSLPIATHTGYGTVNKLYRPALTAKTKMMVNRWQQQSESESGSEAGEVQRILQNGEFKDEEWAGEAKGRSLVNPEQNGTCRPDDEVRRNRSNRREDPRRHTLSGDHHLRTNYQINALNRGMDLESPLSRGYPLPSNSMFDEDPGIMSEVETSSTGFRRGNKQRSSLPVVRTPSKTLERPLGLVFLQYRNETKRSLLPNEITSIDTVKALFVRSFPKQLTMEYLDSPQVKIYIHDSNKDMFYELEDLRSHLNEIRDRSVLRLFESTDVGGGNLPSGLSVPVQIWNDQDQSYFSEPEFDSEFQHQHIHKTKGNKSNLTHQPYYMTHSFPPGSSATLPSRGASLLRPFSPALPVTPKSHAGFTSSPERASTPARGYSPYGRSIYEDPYYSQYGARPSSITPVIDEETSDTELLEDGYSLYGGVKLPAAAPMRSSNFGLSTISSALPFDTTRLRVEHMERQLANLTGLVQKALTQTVPTLCSREHDLSISSDDSFVRTDFKPPKFGKEKERLKPVPPTKPLSLSTQYDGRAMYRDLQLTPELYNQLRKLQKKAKDLRQEVRSLRRMSQAQAHSVRETVRDTYIKIRAMMLNGGESLWAGGADSERIKLNREEDIYKQEIIRLEDDLTELESTVEELRNNVINKKSRVNMSDVENMALILSKSSKTVADLKLKFPLLQSMMKSVMSIEMERVVAEENFLKDEPERLESALRRCKKLTGTLVTLKRLASVQEQRLPDNQLSPTTDEAPMTPTSGKVDGSRTSVGTVGARTGGRSDINSNHTEGSIDSLLDELQIAKSVITPGAGTLRRPHFHPTPETKPPVPERHLELTGKRIPPPPPPRTSSKSPLASPTNPNAPVHLVNIASRKGSLGSLTKILKDKLEQPSVSTSSSCESINSQEGVQQTQSRQVQLEHRHQELLRKQRALQEQYTRLQQLQKSPPPDLVQLQKTGSESNILTKIGVGLTATSISNSLSQLPDQNPEKQTETSSSDSSTSTASTATTTSKTKIYETDIL